MVARRETAQRYFFDRSLALGKSSIGNPVEANRLVAVPVGV
jgi:predicted thioesterase